MKNIIINNTEIKSIHEDTNEESQTRVNEVLKGGHSEFLSTPTSLNANTPWVKYIMSPKVGIVTNE